MIDIEPDQQPPDPDRHGGEFIDWFARQAWSVLRFLLWTVWACPVPATVVVVLALAMAVGGVAGGLAGGAVPAVIGCMVGTRRGRSRAVSAWYWQVRRYRSVAGRRDSTKLGRILGLRDRHGNGRRVTARYNRDGALINLDVDARGVGTAAIERALPVWASTLELAPGSGLVVRAGDHQGKVVVGVIPPSPPLSTVIRCLPLLDEDGGLVLGQREDGRLLVWKPKISPHMLLSGATGSGKSFTIRRVITAADAAGYTIWIGDHYKGSYREWAAGRVGVRHAVAKADIARLCADAVAEMERRYADRRLHCTAPCAPLLLVLDEAADLLDPEPGRSDEAKADQALVAMVRAHITKIGRLGREVGVHLLVAPQRGDASLLGGQLRDQLTCRILQLAHARDSTINMALELSKDSLVPTREPPVRIRDLVAPPGRVLAEIDGGEVVLAQVAS